MTGDIVAEARRPNRKVYWADLKREVDTPIYDGTALRPGNAVAGPTVVETTDTTVVVLNPRWGDAVQANKAGLLETADVFVINKADLPGVRETRRDLEQMLELSAPSDWRPPVVETVASTGDGVDRLWEEIARHHEHLRAGGSLQRIRDERVLREFRTVLAAGIRREVERLEADELGELERRIAEHLVDPYEAAEQLLAGIRRRAATAGEHPG